MDGWGTYLKCAKAANKNAVFSFFWGGDVLGWCFWGFWGVGHKGARLVSDKVGRVGVGRVT